MFVICDLDGTLCNIAHRQHLVFAKQYDEFNALCSEDEVNWDVRNALFALQQQGYTIMFVSGRSSKYRAQTLDWLSKKANFHPERVYLRDIDDYRSDTEVKKSAIETYFGRPMKEIAQEVLCVLEDRDKMVAFWRDNGFNCWQVRSGGY